MKFSIIKFDREFVIWFSFWNNFEAKIDFIVFSIVKKFLYFKEFVELKVKIDIDGLLFISKGYERVKSIFISEYGKISEIVNVYV